MVRSSRHGMGISPQKEVRRSVRERTTVYRSLAENQLGNNFEGIYREHTGYTRSGRKCDNRYNEDSSDSERNYETRRTRRRSLRDEEEHITFSRPKRRKIIVSDMSEHDEVVEESHSMQNGNAYERVRPRRNINGSQSPEKLRNEDNSPSKELRVSLREQRIKNRVIIKTEKADEENEDSKNDLIDDEKRSQQEEEEESITSSSSSSSSSEEDEEEVQGGKRAHYELRRRNTSPTKQAQQSKRHTLRNRSRPSYKEHDPIKESKRNDLQKAKHQRQNYKQRMCRSDSSSTGSDHESNMRRHEDEHFERRKEASMKKARNRFVPMNLTDNELASSQSVIRERMRQQTGASCSDVDPMEVDTTIGFEDIGGLGSHIKSLKEIVLFPMVYPDVFQNFNIKAPRGVLFYGPPGTGKTLVARALANECSRGNKKVAFFMRKGADCLSKWVGESERQLRILFDQAYAMRPSIIFFDEIDGLAPVRSTRQDQIHSSIVSTLLALMDGLDSRGEVIVIGATNRLDSIDPALRRPGRFDKELKFSLPDSAARQQILKIHTAKWGESQPSAEEIDWIAGNTSGYCGADLKYLCTESVMISLRNQFPHIYLSNDRLKLDLSNFKVSKEHIITAMKKITPASRRDFSIPCRPLDDRTSILLQSGLNNILLNLPAGYRCSRNVEATGSCELEKVVRGLEEPPAISATRIFLTGSRRCPDMGQTSYILPALLSKLDHLPVHCISISKLFADGRPEEAFATIFQSALRTAARGPCILLCPSIDEWFKIVPLSVSHMLKISLSQITGFTPILFIASCEGDYDECPEEVTKIFKVQHCLTMAPIPQDIRTQYFKFVCSPALLPPTIFDPSKYPEPEKAVIEDVPVRKLSKEEAEVLENVYEKQLREFRIFIRDQLAKVFRDRRFTPFTEPVTKDVASDYYEIIKKPMCLTQIQQKIDMREYVHPDQFLGDIQLIVDNALEYNPPRDPQGQSIRHNAMSMRDIVEDIFEKEFDEDFVGKLEESARLLIEANIVPKNEKLINLPKGFIRKSKWRVADGFKGNSFTNYTPKGATPASSANRSVKFRGATYNFSNGKKKQKSKDIVQSIARQLNQTSEGKEKEQETLEQVTPTTPLTTKHLTETEIAETLSIPKIEEKTLLIDKEKIDRVISAAVRKTDWWPVPEMEALAASLSNCIENCRDQWDRRALSADLLRIVEECDYEPSTRQQLQNSTDFSASSP